MNTAQDHKAIAAHVQALLGVWHLQRWVIGHSDGRADHFPFGPDASGLIQYTADGGMSACIARADRARLSGQSTRTCPEAERLAAFEGYFHYAGSYWVREKAGQRQVVHRVSHALNPNMVGTEQVRDLSWGADGSLTLSATEVLDGAGVQRFHRLVWRRA